MEPIPEAIVEKTWQEVAGFSPDRAKKEMSQEVRELAIYMFVVVYRMFQKTHGRIKRICSEEIIECYKHNESLMEKLEGFHERFLDRIASVQTSKQPHVVKYVADALM
jgi:uncharacterized coiled-coil DUF342 family protein